MTKKMEFSRSEAIDLLSSIGFEDFSKLPSKERISGKEIFSILIPEDFQFKGKTKSNDEVIIKNGKLVEGYMDIANLGEGSGLLLRNLHHKYGTIRVSRVCPLAIRLQILLVLQFQTHITWRFPIPPIYHNIS